MIKENIKKVEEHDAKMAEVIAEVKASIVIAVWEANIKLALRCGQRRITESSRVACSTIRVKGKNWQH